jgi:hypothetical protein
MPARCGSKWLPIRELPDYCEDFSIVFVVFLLYDNAAYIIHIVLS